MYINVRVLIFVLEYFTIYLICILYIFTDKQIILFNNITKYKY